MVVQNRQVKATQWCSVYGSVWENAAGSAYKRCVVGANKATWWVRRIDRERVG